MITFRDLKDYIDKGYQSANLQIYSNGHQVNILNNDELSICNIVFDEGDEVHVYCCDKPGYADYGKCHKYLLDDNIQLALRLNENAIKASKILSNIA